MPTWQQEVDAKLAETRAATDAMTPQQHYQAALDIVHTRYEQGTRAEAIHARAHTHLLMAQVKLAAGEPWATRNPRSP